MLKKEATHYGLKQLQLLLKTRRDIIF